MHRGAAGGRSGETRERHAIILIAEDSESNQALYSLYFKDTDYRLVFADNGRAAVDIFKETGCDFVLMDLYMPVLDGLDATREIRAFERDNALPPTPLVAVSASTVSDAREDSAAAGCTDFLTKPVRKQTLLDCLARLSGGEAHA